MEKAAGGRVAGPGARPGAVVLDPPITWPPFPAPAGAYIVWPATYRTPILKKNKRRLEADPTRRAFMDDLRREYEDSMATLWPPLARIDETDRLIDQVVYRLYGLTDAEIAMVDEAAG